MEANSEESFTYQFGPVNGINSSSVMACHLSGQI